ncbi:hypothetical protein F4813DRAFT_351662 [Daldinia decipiens]|uniref:uncharacterized protein n=1 Tax=Daldinia decipiens TaxID=326647 RepID=UPI0020C26F2C|nr:uncharacterized protein F4813DRAFT_351662 [Daldinia decipiens]KAI1659684.1 hypothetical protein F4813DRAFT_351662 [Daldinia decipiens]
MLTLLFKAAGMLYVGMAHGSDANYIFDGLFTESHVSEADQKQSKSVAASLINFAYTGNPTYAGDKGFRSWPESFQEIETENKTPELGVSGINLHLIGGPLGTGACFLRKETHTIDSSSERGKMQVPLVADVHFGEIESAAFQEGQRKPELENLFERCAYINTLKIRLTRN